MMHSPTDAATKTSDRKAVVLYMKITHNPLILVLKQNSIKKIMGNKEESKLSFGTTDSWI